MELLCNDCGSHFNENLMEGSSRLTAKCPVCSNLVPISRRLSPEKLSSETQFQPGIKICPKCEYPNTSQERCTACGLVFAKYESRLLARGGIEPSAGLALHLSRFQQSYERLCRHPDQEGAFQEFFEKTLESGLYMEALKKLRQLKESSAGNPQTGKLCDRYSRSVQAASSSQSPGGDFVFLAGPVGIFQMAWPARLTILLLSGAATFAALLALFF